MEVGGGGAGSLHGTHILAKFNTRCGKGRGRETNKSTFLESFSQLISCSVSFRVESKHNVVSGFQLTSCNLMMNI